MLYRKKPGSVWFVKFNHQGATIRKSTRETDRRKAEAEGRRLRVEHEQRAGAGGRRRRVDLRDLVAADLERAAADGAGSSTRADTLKWVWSQLRKKIGDDRDVSTITYDDVLAYVAARRRDKAKGQTIRREVQALKRGLLIADRRGWIGSAPRHWPKIKSDPLDDKQRGKLVSPELIRLVFGELKGDARDEVVFAALTGIRRAELKRVEFSWVEPAPAGLLVPAVLRIPAKSAKTRRERIVGLSQEAVDIVRSRIKEGGDSLVFSQADLKQSLRKACDRAGVPRFHLRDLRHTYATLALAGTSDAVAVQDSLGHTDLRTTQRYQSSTVARTVSAGASVTVALFGSGSSPPGSHLDLKNSIGARSSCGQSTGLLSPNESAVACECCAARCWAMHDLSHTCKSDSSPVVVTHDGGES